MFLSELVKDGSADAFATTCVAHELAFHRSCLEPHAAQACHFEQVIGGTEATVFARRHGLSCSMTLADFRRAVPLRGYDAYRPWIQDEIDNPEGGILTREGAYSFLKTSGTTGLAKVIPQTRSWRTQCRGPAIYQQWSTYIRMYPRIIQSLGGVLDLSWEPLPPSEHLGGRPYYSITNRPAAIGGDDWCPPWYEDAWFSRMAEYADLGYDDRLYRKIRYFAGADLMAIVSVNPSTLVALAEVLASSSERLIRDIHDGTLFTRQFGPADPFLARRLDRASATGGWLTPAALWPNLQLLACWKSAAASQYLPSLEGCFPGVRIVSFSSTGTEGVVTVPVDLDPQASPLAISQAIFEFIDGSVDDLSEETLARQETFTFDELELGRTYVVATSQLNGLYRYVVGDKYRVTGRFGQVPRLEYVGRVGQHASFTGEKLTEDHVVSAFAEIAPQHGLEGARFACCGRWDRPPHYLLLVERAKSGQVAPRLTVAEGFDSALAAQNPEYASKRSSGRLGPARVEFLAGGTFGRHRRLRIAGGAPSTQLKDVLLSTDEQLLREIMELGQEDRRMTR